MLLEADAVARPMDEMIAIAGSADDPPGDPVDPLGGHSRSRARRGFVLSVAHGFVHSREFGVGSVAGIAAGDPHHTCRVAAIATPAAPDVEQHRLTGHNLPVARLVMRRRAVWPGSDDRELCLVVSRGDEAIADLAAELRLGPADQGAK